MSREDLIKYFKEAMRNPDLQIMIDEHGERCLSLGEKAYEDDVCRDLMPYIYAIKTILPTIDERRRRRRNYFVDEELVDMYKPPPSRTIAFGPYENMFMGRKKTIYDKESIAKNLREYYRRKFELMVQSSQSNTTSQSRYSSRRTSPSRRWLRREA